MRFDPGDDIGVVPHPRSADLEALAVREVLPNPADGHATLKKLLGDLIVIPKAPALWRWRERRIVVIAGESWSSAQAQSPFARIALGWPTEKRSRTRVSACVPFSRINKRLPLL